MDSQAKLLNKPTCILMRPDDELVSYWGTVKLLQTARLDRWWLIDLTKRYSVQSETSGIRHLIINKSSVGSIAWREMTSDMQRFFAK